MCCSRPLTLCVAIIPHHPYAHLKFSGNNKNLCVYHKLDIQPVDSNMVKSQPLAQFCYGVTNFRRRVDLEKFKINHTYPNWFEGFGISE